MPDAKPSNSVVEVVGELQKVRAEHDTLLKSILADGGMAVQTRQVLLTHLRDEEQEHIDTIEGLVGGRSTTSPSPSPSTTTSTSTLGRGLTVGVLRRDSRANGVRGSRGSVGSLRGD